MTLGLLTRDRLPALSEGWVEAIFADYGERAAAWRRTKDPFSNPIGHTLRSEIPRLLEALAGGDQQECARALGEILRFRAVQELAPSRAVGFVYLLRDVVRATLAAELAGGARRDELLELDRSIERLALLAFDVYVSFREQVLRLRNQELQRSVASLVRRWGSADEAPAAPEGPYPGGDPS